MSQQYLAILDEKKIGKGTSYLVRVAGYAFDDPQGCQWKSKMLIESQAPHMIKQYEHFRQQQSELKAVQDEAA